MFTPQLVQDLQRLIHLDPRFTFAKPAILNPRERIWVDTSYESIFFQLASTENGVQVRCWNVAATEDCRVAAYECDEATVCDRMAETLDSLTTRKVGA